MASGTRCQRAAARCRSLVVASPLSEPSWLQLSPSRARPWLQSKPCADHPAGVRARSHPRAKLLRSRSAPNGTAALYTFHCVCSIQLRSWLYSWLFSLGSQHEARCGVSWRAVQLAVQLDVLCTHRRTSEHGLRVPLKKCCAIRHVESMFNEQIFDFSLSLLGSFFKTNVVHDEDVKLIFECDLLM